MSGVPEGNLYRNEDNGAIYLILDGKARHIPDPATFSAVIRGGTATPAIRSFDLSTSGGPLCVGLPLMSGAQMIRDDSNGAVYLMDKEASGRIVKRHVTSPGQMDRYHFTWDVVHMTHATAEAIPTGVSP
jgi:hypothetical protein